MKAAFGRVPVPKGLEKVAAEIQTNKQQNQTIFTLKPSRCKCGNELRHWKGVTTEMNMFEFYECRQCYRLVIVEKVTGMPQWYAREPERKILC